LTLSYRCKVPLRAPRVMKPRGPGRGWVLDIVFVDHRERSGGGGRKGGGGAREKATHEQKVQDSNVAARGRLLETEGALQLSVSRGDRKKRARSEWPRSDDRLSGCGSLSYRCKVPLYRAGYEAATARGCVLDKVFVDRRDRGRVGGGAGTKGEKRLTCARLRAVDSG